MKKVTLLMCRTGYRGKKISRHLFWSTDHWPVLQNKCLDILTPLEAVLNLNKVSSFFSKQKKQQHYFWALTNDQCSEIMFLLFFCCICELWGWWGKCRRFPKMFPNQFFHSKPSFFDRKVRIFKQKIPARAPQLEARSGIGLSCKVLCYERACCH